MEQQPGRLAQAAGQVLRSGKMVLKAMTPRKEGGAPPSPGRADFGASGQASGLPSASPARLLQRMQAALGVGGNGRQQSVEPSSFTFQDVTPVRPRRPEAARPSDVDAQADATSKEQILKELHRMQERIEERFSALHAEVTAVKAEVQQVRTEVTSEAQLVRAEVTAEMQQLRAQVLGTAEGLVQIEQRLQREVAQMCAKLEMMQNEQEKKKGNEEERLNALVCKRVEEIEQQLQEHQQSLEEMVCKRVDEIAQQLQEHQQSLEEWIEERMGQEFEQQERRQREFNKKIAAQVDNLKQESASKVTNVLAKCEQMAERLSPAGSVTSDAPEELRFEAEKLADNDKADGKTTSMLAQNQSETGEPLNFNFGGVTGGVVTGSLSPAGSVTSDAPQELRYEAEKLADNDQDAMAASERAQSQREKIGVAAEAQAEPTLDAADAQKEPALDLNQRGKNEAPAGAHMVGSRRIILLYGDRNEHGKIEGGQVYERTEVSEYVADADGGSGTEGGMVLVLRDAAGVVQDVLVRVGARTSVSQVRAVAIRELMRRGVHNKLVYKFYISLTLSLQFSGRYLKDDDIIARYVEGLDARLVVHMPLTPGYWDSAPNSIREPRSSDCSSARLRCS